MKDSNYLRPCMNWSDTTTSEEKATQCVSCVCQIINKCSEEEKTDEENDNSVC